MAALKVDSDFKEEILDWQYESGLKAIKFPNLYMIPYKLTSTGVVESRVALIDPEEQNQFFPATPFSEVDQPLQLGDQLIAVDGKPIAKIYELLKDLQNSKNKK